jgi:hypothetical protein
MTLDEAIAYLKSRGLHAIERDWPMGETAVKYIGIFADPIQTGVKTEFGDLFIWKQAIYIAPAAGGWIVGAPNSKWSEAMPLETACIQVEKIFPTTNGAPNIRFNPDGYAAG